MAQRKYRGKYPNNISQAWGTYENGVYGVRTNAGAVLYYSAPAAKAAGYTICHSQLLGLDVSTLGFMCASIQAASQQRARYLGGPLPMGWPAQAQQGHA